MAGAHAARPVERKVKASTVAAYIVSVVGLAILNAVQDASVVDLLPAWLSPFIVALVPAAAAAIAGWQAHHTPRPDLGPLGDAPRR